MEENCQYVVFKQCLFMFYSVAICERLSDTLLDTLDNQPTIKYPDNPITYGMEVLMNCTVEGGLTTQRKRTCLYDVESSSYKLIGESLECGSEYWCILF